MFRMRRHPKIPTAADRAELTRLAIEAVKHNPDPAYREEVHRRAAERWRELVERGDEIMLRGPDTAPAEAPVHGDRLSAPGAMNFREEHRRFLAVNRPDILAELEEAGDLDDYLASVGETAESMFDYL